MHAQLAVATATAQPSTDRWTARRRTSTALNLVGASAVAAAAGAGSPLFVYEQGRWAFPDSTLTVMFSIYALTLLSTLLVAGSLSDHLGRRPVLIGALLLLVVASCAFLLADSAGWLVAARAVQGVATGAATSTFTAMISENAPAPSRDRMTQIAGTVPIGGLALGALGAGVAVQASDAPVVAVFVPVIVLVGVAVTGALVTPETSARTPGALRSLVPHVAVPARLRSSFVRAAVLVSVSWMMSGLFLGLMPTVARAVLGLGGLAAAAITFLQPATAAVAGLTLTRLRVEQAALVGAVGCTLGGLLVAAGILTASTPLVVLAALLGGFGNGIGFSAALRPLNQAARTDERGGLMSAVYVVAYLSYGLPALVAGQLVAHIGTSVTTAGYGVLIAAVGAGALTTRTRDPRRPHAHSSDHREERP